jgi:hypothetical protein
MLNPLCPNVVEDNKNDECSILLENLDLLLESSTSKMFVYFKKRLTNLLKCCFEILAESNQKS